MLVGLCSLFPASSGKSIITAAFQIEKIFKTVVWLLNVLLRTKEKNFCAKNTASGLSLPYHFA